jgi:hypothetical protein
MEFLRFFVQREMNVDQFKFQDDREDLDYRADEEVQSQELNPVSLVQSIVNYDYKECEKRYEIPSRVRFM